MSFLSFPRVHVDTLNTLNTLDIADTMDTVDTLDTLNTLFTLDTSDTLGILATENEDFLLLSRNSSMKSINPASVFYKTLPPTSIISTPLGKFELDNHH